MSQQLDDLENKVAQLIELCSRLHEENQRLKADCEAARIEKVRLRSRNREASRQIGAIVNELELVLK